MLKREKHKTKAHLFCTQKFFFSLSLSFALLIFSTMALLSLPAKAENFAHAIYEFQCDTGNKKAFCIKTTLQELVDHVAATEPINSLLLDVPKRKTRAVASTSFRFYDSSWLINTNKFFETIAHFKKLITNSQTIDSFLQQSIASGVTSAVVITVISIQAKHDNEMLSLQEIIEKSLLVKESLSATPPPDYDATPKEHPSNNSLPKTTTERWNQADLGYFNPYLNITHREGEIVLVGQDV